MKRGQLTLRDLMVLRLLVERPMHGHEAHLQLERRTVQDSAEISRPAVYKSLKKLLRLGLIRPAREHGAHSERRRHVFGATLRSGTVLRRTLHQDWWASSPAAPPFVTWIALSPSVPIAEVNRHVRRRLQFLQKELARKRSNLAEIRQQDRGGPQQKVWVARFQVEQCRSELSWVRKLARELGMPAR